MPKQDQPKLKLANQLVLDREIIHYAQGDTLISSKFATIYFNRGAEEKKIKLPTSPLKKPFGLLRLGRRALRLDKCNVFLHQQNLIIIRQGQVYLYKRDEDRLIPTLQLKNCRNVLHQSINSSPDGYIYFGEYGANKERKPVPVYRSVDGGESWEEIYTFPAGSIKHVHGCFYDKYSDKIWVCTGDFEDENWLLVADKDFKTINKIGDGQQQFRTCNLIFTETEVHWLMDSQLEPSYHIIYNRATADIQVGQQMMGPVWYVKELTDGYYLAATTQEIGDGVLDDKAHLYYSTDLKTWHTLALFEHDGYPMRYFKFGIIGFADGLQSSQDFYMFFEAIKGVDGKSLYCRLEA